MKPRTDTVTTIGSSIVQHGHLNDRIYLMHLAREDLPGLLDTLDDLARMEDYSKIFAKVPASSRDLFLIRGYVAEACIPGFFRGRIDGYFMAKYFASARSVAMTAYDDVLSAAEERGGDASPCPLPPAFSCSSATPADAPAIAALYREVFETYPFPIHDPDYIARTMEGEFRYYCVRACGRIVAVSSVEMDRDALAVEMSDFATHPDYRGCGLAGALLGLMERDMQEEGMLTAFTIARAASYPVNITFARAGYAYGGTLVNNTQICGSFESMNVWYKPLF
ncbi:hypothetical protein ABH15_03005 [Methanoculleus taiwanensis]|uniref:N-acetyltransferase domain-containing protein n=1 Tax=Methanoculleus taiwanensis TaxID=1550565 RepID=A0A498H5B9_9EURY|nr:putative beta-lysine N-acetyltransferase [Methanoculleus taiwanensis]RXE57110.1 hypothetical protein ABH15_03005 [Methanoculleus taiwanensis]